MAVRGVGPFKNKSPLRALAVFPSWDRLVIAVSPRLGVNSMAAEKFFVELDRTRNVLGINCDMFKLIIHNTPI